MSAHHVEVETKLVLPERDGGQDPLGLPFAALPGVAATTGPDEVTMVAEYHDTADLALLRGRLTLRRRVGGHDEGWHLKLPDAGGARLERHEPLDDGRAGVPAPLLGLARSRHRDEPLQVVATLTTRRRTLLLRGADGRVLVEVADDTVSAEVPPSTVADGGEARSAWREVEVELVDGDEAVLRAAVGLLTEAGAEPAPHGSKLAHVLQRAGAPGATGRVPAGPAEPPTGTAAVLLGAVAAHVATLLEQDPRVRLGLPEAVHDMRVATRRLRSLLATFRPLLDRDVSEPLRAELRWLGEVLGGPRDAEVLRDRLAVRVAELPGEEARTWPAAAGTAPGPGASVAGTGVEDAVAALDGPRYLRLLADLDAFGANPPVVAHAGRRKGTRRAARKAYRRLARALDAVPADAGPEQDEALHDARKAAKRLRYTCETAAAVHGGRARRLARRAEAVQDVLGEHQDSVVARQVLHGAAGRAGSSDEVFLLGTLAGLELALARRTPEDLDRPVRRLHGAAARWFG